MLLHPSNNGFLRRLAPSTTEATAGVVRLYGRKYETKQLVRAYELSKSGANLEQQFRATCSNEKPQNVVVVHGPSGSGKTALVHQLQPLVTQDEGLFLSGKFDCQDPLAVFVAVLSHFVSEITTCGTNNATDDHFQRIQHATQNAVGNEGRLLTDLVPSLKTIIGHHTDVEKGELCSGDAMHRLQFVLCKFFRAVLTVVPLVLFFDDLQWSDKTSLDFIQALIQFPLTSDTSCHLLIVAAYRCDVLRSSHALTEPRCKLNCSSSRPCKRAGDNSEHHFDDFLQQVRPLSTSTHTTNIQVGNLSETQVNKLVAGYLQLTPDSCVSLSRLVFSKSQGNALHATRYLHHLSNQGILYHNGRWTWNEQMLLSVQESSVSVKELFRQRLKAMPSFTLEVLQTANCMGDEIDEVALALVLDDRLRDISQALKDAASEDLVLLNPHRGRYVFVHDRIRQAVALTVKDPDSLPSTTGQILLLCASAPYVSTNLCAIAKLLNHNIELIQDRDERYNAAALNLEAGQKAASLGAFLDASSYLKAGIKFLQGGQYWSERYTLSLGLFTHASDVEVSNANYARVEALVEEILLNATCLDDKLPVYLTRIDCIGQQGNLSLAVDSGLEVLRLLGEEFPHPSNTMAIRAEKLKVEMALMGRNIADLSSLPPMQDKTKIAVMQVLGAICSYAYQMGAVYSEMFTVRMVHLMLRYGLVKMGAIAFVLYGMTFHTSNWKQGYRFGQLALSIVDKTQAKEVKARVYDWMYAFIHHWTRPIKESLEPLHHAQLVSIEQGDFEYTALAAHFRGVNSLFSGRSLPEVAEMLTDAVKLMKAYKQSNVLGMTKPVLQYVHNLMDSSSNSKFLAGDSASPNEVVVACGKNMALMLGCCYYSASAAFLFGDVELADEFMERRRNMKFQSPAVFRYAVSRLTEGLIAIARIRQGFQPKKYLKIARQIFKQLTKWSRDCQENFCSKRLLLEAEMLSLSKGTKLRKTISELYNQSISLALQEGFTHEAALACELAGDYMSRCGAIDDAVVDWNRACVLYKRWGATAKENQLRSRIAVFS